MSRYRGMGGCSAPLDHGQSQAGSQVSTNPPYMSGSFELPFRNALATDDEYSVVIRVFMDVEIPNGYKYVDGKEASPLLEYAREMTLAKGRVLYEVWDRWTSCFKGYIVPTTILSEALSNQSVFDSWSNLRFHDRTVRDHAHSSILDQFPRIRPIAAKIIAEKMIIEKRRVTPRNVEEDVVSHVRHFWTSYEFRFSAKDREGKFTKKEDVLEIIKPRMRGILRKWLPACADGTNLAILWSRHHLLDDEKGAGPCREKDIFYTSSSLTWFGGKETAGNLGNYQRAFL